MEEKLLKEMMVVLNELKEKLNVNQGFTVRGPVGDPGPDFPHYPHHFQFPKKFPWPIGYNVDPSPEYFLGKDKLAVVKIKELDIIISNLNAQIDLLKTQRDLMKQEYNIK